MKTFIYTSLMVLVLASCSHQRVKNSDQTVVTSSDDSTIDNQPAQLETETGEPASYRIGDEQKGDKVQAEEFDQIPSEINPSVEMWIRYFQGRGRHHMERYLSRSTRYEGLMKKVLSDNGLPEDLFYIALIESGFSSQAISHASAVGYWQFIRGTGKRFGLEINQLVDERRDPVVATQAAANYFKDLYREFGSWYLSMASYNVGEGRVARVVKKYKTRDFWDLVRNRRALPKETVNYVPKFLAAKLIAKNPDEYGFGEIDYLPPIEFDHVVVTEPVNLRLMAEKMGLNYEDFKALNPKFKGEVAPVKNAQLELRVPPGMTEKALLAAQESSVDKVEFIANDDTRLYKVQRGESLNNIARKFRTSVAYLRDLNDIPRRKSLKAGTMLHVPDRTPLIAKRPEYVKKNIVKPSQVRTTLSGDQVYVVQPGDSLYSIANKYKVTVNQLKRVNNIRRGSKIRAGIKIVIPTGKDERRASDNSSGAKRSKGNQRSIAKANINSKKSVTNNKSSLGKRAVARSEKEESQRRY